MIAYPDILAVIDEREIAANSALPNRPTEKTSATVSRYWHKDAIATGIDDDINPVSSFLNDVVGSSPTRAIEWRDRMSETSGAMLADISSWQHSWVCVTKVESAFKLPGKFCKRRRRSWTWSTTASSKFCANNGVELVVGQEDMVVVIRRCPHGWLQTITSPGMISTI